MAREIVVNGRFENWPMSGVRRYATELLRRLGPAVKTLKPNAGTPEAAGLLWEQFVLPRMLDQDAFLWSPADTGPLSLERQAVTMHDLSVLDHPEWFPARTHFIYRTLLPRLARRASLVLTVSQHSRRSILTRLGLSPEKVAVVPCGVDQAEFHPCDAGGVRAKYQIQQRYVLFVGSLDQRKNLDRLLLAWSRLPEFKDIELVVVGGRPRIARSAEYPRNRRRTRFLGYVPEEDLPGLYSGATFFFMPSLFEAFGFTVLEAMACGTPVICSYAGGLPEVTGKAALLIDPTSVEGMTEAMRNLLLSEELRSDLREKGLERACQFSWDESARKIAELLRTSASAGA